MLILALDTNSSYGSVAVLEDRRLLGEVNLDSIQTHSERLLPAVDYLLISLGIGVPDIDGFALAVGPGSFTGIRIGMSTLKSFAFVLEKKIAPVSNLTALAVKLEQTQSRLLCPILDAKKNEIYAALFEKKNRQRTEIIPQGVYAPDVFISRLPTARVINFIGTGAEVYKDKIRTLCRDKARFSRRNLFIGNEVGILGYDILKAGKGMDFNLIEPLYFRKSQAEERNKQS